MKGFYKMDRDQFFERLNKLEADTEALTKTLSEYAERGNAEIIVDNDAWEIIQENVENNIQFSGDDILKLDDLHEQWQTTGKLQDNWGKVCKPTTITIKDSTHSRKRKIGRKISKSKVIEYIRSSLIMFDQGFNEKEQNHVRLYMSTTGAVVVAVEHVDSEKGTLVTTWERPFKSGYEEFIEEVLKWYRMKKSGKRLPNSLLTI